MISKRLHFIGNWYFDCGIIGFLSVIDDVFGEEVNNILSNINICKKNNTFQFNDEINKIFFKAYWISYAKEQLTDPELKLERKEKVKIENKLNELINIDNVDDFIKKLNNLNENITIRLPQKGKDKKKKLIHKNMSSFYKNFAFFNVSNKEILEDSKKYFFEYDYYKNKKRSMAVESIDRTINKFLLSYGEFKNEFFDQPLKIEEIEDQLNMPLHIFLVCVEKGFVNFSNVKENIFIHTPSIEASWKIHKKLKILKERFLKQKESRYDIFSLTTTSIIDALYEEKSEWVLRNLLVVTYSSISPRQEIKNVKFLPFDKNVATLLKEQKIRKYALANVEISRNNKKQQIYGIEGLIYKKPLAPFLVEFIKAQIKKNMAKIQRNTQTQFLHWSTIDLLNYGVYKNSEVNITQKYENTLRELKHIHNIFSDQFKIDKDKAKDYVHLLIKEIRNLDRFNFTNHLLKLIWEKHMEKSIMKNEEFQRLINYLFKILSYDIFIPYAIPILLGLYTQCSN
jgi:CRISPR-associated protein Cst1